jgi:signal peptidase I
MTKRKSPVANPRSLASKLATPSGNTAGEPAPGAHRLLPSSAAIREAVESVAIAFILAFLFRTFEAEAFVIPTGSMAPTLMGRHKDVICPKCGCPYQVSASEEVNPDGSLREAGPDGMRRSPDAFAVVSGTCPMCRYTDQWKNDISYNGDRILVNKFAYEVADPERWDVIVFKYPGDPPNVPPNEHNDSRTNFIKRLVGLPGETVRIQNGDIWLIHPEDKGKGSATRKAIKRKPGPKLLAMLQPVFDTDYVPRITEDRRWPNRWYRSSTPDSPPESERAGAWRTNDGEKTTFSIDGTAKDDQWLRYHHLAPSYEQWQAAIRGAEPRLSPQLITDFCAYNTGKMRIDANVRPGPAFEGLGQHWVGDLAVECTLESETAAGEFTIELCKGGRQFQCRFDLSNGRATLSILGQPDVANWHPTASTVVRGKGRHKILFSNCDNELRLWVDGSAVRFDADTTYPDLRNHQPDAADLAPVGVASKGAAVRIDRLQVLRDIYYIADCYVDYRSDQDPDKHFDPHHDVSYRPGDAVPGRATMLPEGGIDYIDFSLKADQFFVLGDNSAKSKDARLWGPDHFVPRDLLIGKALFIYWPHSWDRLPVVDIPFPYFPNFSRMGLVR